MIGLVICCCVCLLYIYIQYRDFTRQEDEKVKLYNRIEELEKKVNNDKQ